MFGRRKGLIALAVAVALLSATVAAAQPFRPVWKDKTSAWNVLLDWLGAQAGRFTATWAEEGSSPDPDGKPTAAPQPAGSGSDTDEGSSPDPSG
jgi:hypothetical protein